MKFLIIGFGSIGKRHAQNCSALGHDVILLRRNKNGNEPYATFTDLETAFLERPDAVIIANPTSYHVPLALRVASHGCHMLIEKPLSHSLQGVQELINLVEKNSCIAMIGYQFRFHTALRMMKKCIDEGAIGNVLCGRVEVGQYLPNWHKDEDYTQSYAARRDLGGGVMLTLIHELDYLSFMMGIPKTMDATLARVSDLKIDVSDVAEITILYEGNKIGQCHMDYLQKNPSRWLKIIGERGELFWDGIENKLELRTDSIEVLYHDPLYARNTMFVDELHYFIDCITTGHQPATNLSQDVTLLSLTIVAHEKAMKQL